MAIENSESKNYPIAQKLGHFFHSYSDEIPQKIIHSTSANKYYKVRKGWLQSVVSVFDQAIYEQRLLGETSQKVQDFVDVICSNKFRTKKG